MPDRKDLPLDADGAESTRQKIAGWACIGFGLLCLGLGVFRLLQGNTGGATIGLGAGLVLMFAATIERFESLKALGVEAKTRVRDLRATIEDAEKATARLRPVAQMALRGLVQLNASAGRWSVASPPIAIYQETRDIKRVLGDLGSSDADVREALLPWARFSCVDVAFTILRPFERSLGAIQNARQEVVQAIPQPIQPHDKERFDAAVQAVREVGEYKQGILDQIAKWRLDQFTEKLQDIVANVPEFAKPEPFDALKSQVVRWAPEFDYLAKEFDFRIPEMWFEQIRKEQGE